MGGDLNIQGGAIQTATGNIDIAVGGNLVLGSVPILGDPTGQITALGSIRTTGRPTTDISSYWLYDNGGNITLRVAGSVKGGLQADSWDYDYQRYTTTRPRKLVHNWGAMYVDKSGVGYHATAGLATMGGGNLSVYAGGDFLCQSGTFGNGQGNLTIFAGGDLNGSSWSAMVRRN